MIEQVTLRANSLLIYCDISSWIIVVDSLKLFTWCYFGESFGNLPELKAQIARRLNELLYEIGLINRPTFNFSNLKLIELNISCLVLVK